MIKEVSREEFLAFIKNYKEPLETDICYIVEPPTKTYNIIKNGSAYPVAWFYEDYLDGNKKHYEIRIEQEI